MSKPTTTAPTERCRSIVKGWTGLSRKNGRSRTQNWRDVRKGLLPSPFELGPNAVAWWEDEIDANLAARPRRRYGVSKA
jgi:predicted DNA-binding transcriptional regulator AlpA